MIRFSPQTPSEVTDSLVSALTLVSSPRFLGPALATRYILPTITLKTGNIGYKRTTFMLSYPDGILSPSLLNRHSIQSISKSISSYSHSHSSIHYTRSNSL